VPECADSLLVCMGQILERCDTTATKNIGTGVRRSLSKISLQNVTQNQRKLCNKKV
jgi:hypothetical protein